MPDPPHAGPSIQRRLVELLSRPNYQPLNKTDLARRLKIPIDERSAFRRLLKNWEDQGRLTRIRKERYVLPAVADLLIGRIQINPQGFGWVVNDTHDGRGDIYVSAEQTGTAFHQDKVVVRIVGNIPGGERRGRAKLQGQVIRVVERARSQLVGTLQRSKKFYYVVPDDPALIHNVYVQPPEPGTDRPVEGDKVVVRLVEWENRHVSPEGELVERLGSSDTPGVDILAIIRKHDLATEFPADVLAEAAGLPLEPPSKEIRQREDLRGLTVFTIDPVDARDFDDAIHVVKTPMGWEIGIHIADVSFFVRPGTQLDREAYRRGNSVYLPDRVLPMLPERISNGICSLRPAEDRLCKSVIVEIGSQGELVKFRFAATVIRSEYRLTYAEALTRLERKPIDQLDRQLHAAWAIAHKLRKRRFQAGSLDLEMPEVRVVLDANGRATGLVKETNDISHQLIEELMLLANEIVGRITKERSLPSIYRIHEDPDPQKLADLREVFHAHGIETGDLGSRRTLQKAIRAIAGRPDEPSLKVALLRSLRKAVYSPDPIGHFGLAKADYAHFTSPIRRYADLVVHRTFNQLLPRPVTGLGKSMGRSDRLAAVCEHISNTERVAAEAEREAVRFKKMEYLESLVRRPHRLVANVVEVRSYGLAVGIDEALLTGLIHISELGDDFFVYDGARQQIVGRRSKQTYRVGDKLNVRVDRVDRFKQQVDFVPARIS